MAPNQQFRVVSLDLQSSNVIMKERKSTAEAVSTLEFLAI